MAVDALKDIDEVGVEIRELHSADRQQALDGADALCAEFGPGEQPVAPTHGARPEPALQMVGIHGDFGVVEKHPQARLALRGIGQSLAERVIRQQVGALALLPAPGKKGIHRRRAVLAALGELSGAVELLLANPLLVPVQHAEQRQRPVLGLRIARAGLGGIAPAMRPAAGVDQTACHSRSNTPHFLE